MKKKKITQAKAVFYKLWKAYQLDKERWLPAHEFVGEMFVEEVNKWVLMSYKCPTNGLEIYFSNPDLIERQWVTGKSGSKYYQYRLKEPSIEKVKDKELVEFYYDLKKKVRYE